MEKEKIAIFIEKYKILWSSFDNEMNRFWQRYNVLISIQIIAISLFKLVDNKHISNPTQIIIYFMLSFLSFITIKIVNRAINVYQYNLKLIEKFENENSDFILYTAENISNFKINEPKAYYYARMIPIILFLFWIALLTYNITIVLNI